MEIVKKRIVFLDVLKAIAIFLVVWGHSMQNFTTDKLYWEYDACIQVIYSFHMPLFMMISGFFSASLLKRVLVFNASFLFVGAYGQTIREKV